MILVTVGTHNRGFDRLVRAADELATLTDEPVVIQYGSSKYEPRHACRSFRLTTSQEMEYLTLQARVIIMHAAVWFAHPCLENGQTTGDGAAFKDI